MAALGESGMLLEMHMAVSLLPILMMVPILKIKLFLMHGISIKIREVMTRLSESVTRFRARSERFNWNDDHKIKQFDFLLNFWTPPVFAISCSRKKTRFHSTLVRIISLFIFNYYLCSLVEIIIFYWSSRECKILCGSQLITLWCPCHRVTAPQPGENHKTVNL